MPRSAPIFSFSAVKSPPGARHQLIRASPPAALSIIALASPISATCCWCDWVCIGCGWSTVWSHRRWPSARIRCTAAGWAFALSPISQNVALASYFASRSSTWPVAGPGPSSKVSATVLPPEAVCRSTLPAGACPCWPPDGCEAPGAGVPGSAVADGVVRGADGEGVRVGVVGSWLGVANGEDSVAPWPGVGRAATEEVPLALGVVLALGEAECCAASPAAVGVPCAPHATSRAGASSAEAPRRRERRRADMRDFTMERLLTSYRPPEDGASGRIRRQVRTRWFRPGVRCATGRAPNGSGQNANQRTAASPSRSESTRRRNSAAADGFPGDCWATHAALAVSRAPRSTAKPGHSRTSQP